MGNIDSFWEDTPADEMAKKSVESMAQINRNIQNRNRSAHDWLDARERAQRFENDRIEQERDTWQRERYHRTQEALEREGRTKPQITHRQPRVYKLQRVSYGLMGGEWAVNCNNRITYVGSKQACEMHISINAVADFDQVIR